MDRPKQVWCSDITYPPVRRGFRYLVAIMDWHNRKVLSWLISNTLEADFCPSRRIYFANRLRGNGSIGKA
ncbi:MAG: DDE-type integrase/transposase/recombinase, partial [Pseudomonadota bacterium]